MKRRHRLLERAATLVPLTLVLTASLAVTGGAPAEAVTCPSQAALYGVATDGRLIGYIDRNIYGGTGSIANSGMTNPTWGGLTHVFSGGHGVIYGVTTTGVLKSYKDIDPLDTRSPVAVKTYGPNWDSFRLLWGNDQGVIYGIRHDGTLVTYKQSDPWNGDGAISLVATFNSTWGSIRYAWSSGRNVFYGIDTGGTLHTYVHTGWSAGGGTITNGSYTNRTWGQIRLAWSPAPGVIYGISTAGVLHSYRDNAPTTGAGPVSGIKYNINSTWGSIKHVFPDQQLCSSPVDAVRNRIVAIAKGELGEVGGEKYGGGGQPWCGYFASWVWARAGVSGWGTVPAVQTWWDRGMDERRFRTRGPQVGDVAVWKGPGISHVAIVVGVRSDGYIQTIGGNENNAVRFTNWARPSAINDSFRGFVSPVVLR